MRSCRRIGSVYLPAVVLALQGKHRCRDERRRVFREDTLPLRTVVLERLNAGAVDALADVHIVEYPHLLHMTGEWYCSAWFRFSTNKNDTVPLRATTQDEWRWQRSKT
jgi:hypothetical protein